MRYELRAFHAPLDEAFFFKGNFCMHFDQVIQSILQPIIDSKDSAQKLYPENIKPHANSLFIDVLMDKSPGNESLGMKYIYGEAGPNDSKFTFTNLLNFAYYYVTIRACYGSHAQPDCSNPTLILTQTSKNKDADEVENIKVESFWSQDELSWDIPKNPNGPILYFLVKFNGTEEPARCITYQEYITNGRKVIITDSQSDLLSVSMRSVGSNWNFKPAEVKVKSKIQTSQAMWKIYLLLLVLGIIIVIVVMASYLFWQKRKTNRFKLPINTVTQIIKPFESDDNYEVARESVELSCEIGNGNFGKVFEGTLRTTDGGIQSVAIKKVNEGATLEESTNFLKEATTMKSFESFHIVQLLGIVSKTQPYLVIMELMVNGDLKTFLRKNRPVGGTKTTSNSYTAFELLQIIPLVSHMAIQIADGMAYMEQKKIVHRDLAARNCMVAADYTVKIGDFGLSRDVHMSDYYRIRPDTDIPVRWMAPECLRDGTFSSQSDVFSYGIVLWEIVTYGEQPYQELSDEQVFEFVKKGRTERKPKENCPENIFKLMQKCWKLDPYERISFFEIIEALIAEAPKKFYEHSFYGLSD